MRYVVATRNRHKLAELERLLAPLELELLPEHVALPPETGATFRDNALLKARAASTALDRPVLADDSGLCVEALGGRPGVRSARYAGEGASDRANLEKLVREMSGRADRRAAFVCVLALVDPREGRELVVEGRCEGVLADAPRGEGGFGYDPLFIPDDLGDGRTMAELEPGEKNAISHRGRAAQALLRELGLRS